MGERGGGGGGGAGGGGGGGMEARKRENGSKEGENWRMEGGKIRKRQNIDCKKGKKLKGENGKE